MEREEVPTALPIIGTEEATLDSKGRILLSKKKRDRLGADFVISVSDVGCLVMHPKAKWDAIVRDVLSAPATNLGRQQYARLVLGTAEDEVNCDGQGRFVLPNRLRERVGIAIGDRLLLIGTGDGCEIWEEREYARFESDPDGYGAARRESVDRAQRKMTGGPA